MRAGHVLTYATVFAVLSSFALFFAEREGRIDSVYFSDVLEAYRVYEEVSSGNRTYVVSGSSATLGGTAVAGKERLRVLSLAYEKTLARRQPLFALPGTDLTQMLDVIEDVDDVKNRLSSLQTTSRDAQLLQNGLYPTDMLRSIVVAEKARRQFLSTGKKADALKYERALGNAIAEYQDALVRFENAFKKSVPQDVRQYAVPSAIIDRSSTLATIDMLQETASLSLSRYLKRISCVHGVIRACEKDALTYPLLNTVATPPPSSEQIALSRDIMRALTRVPFEFDDALGGRLILLGSSSCMVNDPDGAPIFSVRVVFPGLPESRLAPLNVGNTLFLHAPKGSSYAKLPYLKSFVDQGIEYALAHPLIYYECPATATDLGAVMAVRDVVLFATQNELSAHAVGETAAKLHSLESRLRNAPIVYESDAATFLHEAASLTTDPSVPRAIRDAVSELTLAYTLRSGGVLSALHNISTAERMNMRQSAEQGIPMDFSLRNMIYARSALPALFLADNPSVAKEYVQVFRKNTLPPSEQPYVYYSSFAHSPNGWATLLESVRFYHKTFEL